VNGGRASRVTFRLSDRAIRLVIKPLVFAASVLPMALLVWSAVRHQFNANPFNAIVRSSGYWSLRLLCLTLAVTPVRWVTGWHVVVKFRRMMGLFAFFYAVVHVVAYVLFDRIAALDMADRTDVLVAAGRVLSAIAVDVAQRPFFLVGFMAFVLLVPLAATSTSGMIRRLGGRRWQVLHRCIYSAAIASVVHTYWPLRGIERYELILGLVLIVRICRAAVPDRSPLLRRAFLSLSRSISS
jgi:methionine sulfoxide reductase heme-binding subunit